MINVAIIGLGWWGRYIVNAVQGKSDKIRIVRAVDIAPEAAGELAAEKGFVLTADLQDALDDDGVDAVILTTPHELHDEQVARVAAAGKHVFCEKPLSLSAAGAIRSVAACRDAGVVLGVGHERRFEPALIEIKRMIDDGELGTVLHVEASFSHDSLADVPLDNWRVSDPKVPAAMTGMGIHLTDAFLHMLGPIESVVAVPAHRVAAYPAGDVISVVTTFASGATGYINSVMATAFFMRFHVFGTEGWVEARDSVRPEAVGDVTFTTCRIDDATPNVRMVGSIDTVIANLHAFADAASGGAPYPFTDDELSGNIAVLEAISQSATTGESIDVSNDSSS